MTEFIFMLTVDDMTVSDAMDQYCSVRATGLRWVGFKDIGLPHSALRELADLIRLDGRKVALEVVSLDEDAEKRSVEAALDIGVDLLMGGTHPHLILPLLAGSNVLYFPFPGRVVSHPSLLEGTIEEIAKSAAELSAHRGVHGLDLLAYRFNGDVPALMRRVVDAACTPVVVAGSIDSLTKIAAVREAGAWGFTVGSAIFAKEFPAARTTADQVAFVLESLAQPIALRA